MFEKIIEENILFLDIETVPQYRSYYEMPLSFKKLWDKKAVFLNKDNSSVEEIYERAGIYAEFGKIICISAGVISKKNDERIVRIKSFAGDDENKLLNEFNSLLGKSFNKQYHYLCAHNGKEFDYPYIARRTLINGLRIPKLLNIAGKKPWEIRHIDTMELWKFGDYKHYTSLELLTTIFDIPTPKDDIKGSDVAKVYWQQKDLKRIVEYCQKDVVAIVQLFLKYKRENLIAEHNISFIE